MTIKEDEFKPLIYENAPTRFGINDIEDFVIWAVKQGTSDITIQTDENIICDIHGKKHRVTRKRLSKTEVIEIIAAIYRSDGALSRLNGGNDVDMQWSIKVDRDVSLRFRVNMTAILSHDQKGYQITIRTITGRAPLLETLNIPQEIIDNMCVKQGLIVVTGATGSGKSTLLASIIDWRIRDPKSHLKILTYEQPIEYVYDDVPKPTSSIAQTEIGLHLDNFVAGIRNALRRKPEVILMGELRDKETIGEGINAAMTGHLVYGTLHTNGVADAVRRMVNVFGVEEKSARAMDVLTSLKMVVAQMLVPSTDGKRTAIREYLVFNQEIVDYLLDAGVDNLTNETRKMLLKYGKTFVQDAQEKLDAGMITEEEFELIKRSTEGVKK